MSKFYHRHFKQLQELSTNCIIAGRTFFFLNIPSDMEFPEGFPKGRLVETTEKTNKYSFLAASVLNYLYSVDRSKYDAKMLRSEMRSVDMSMKMLLMHASEVETNEHKRRK